MKCYIYVTKSEPYLWKYHCVSDNFNGIGFETSYSKKEHDSTDDGEILNGKIVASFELNKVDMYDLPRLEYYGYIGLIKNTLKYSCLNYEQLEEYVGNKDFYAWHIDNLEILDKPLVIMGKAPQSWQYCRDIVNGTNECCILISIKPEWVCKILNEEKTIEVRKTAPKELIK